MKMYHLRRNDVYSPIISEIEVESESNHTVTMRGRSGYLRRRHKKTEWYCILPTFEEAQEEAIDFYGDLVKRRKADLERARSYLGEAKAIKKQDVHKDAHF